MKYTGMGISLGAKNIHLSVDWPVGGLPEADSTSGQFTIRASCDAFDLTGISFTEYSVPGYALTVCSEYADFSEKIQIENY